MESKKCFKCGEVQPLSYFYKHKMMADGRVNKCKECNKKDVRENYSSNREHYREYERTRSNLEHRVKAREDYAKTDNGKESGNRAKKAYAKRNPIKKAAAQMVSNAVRDGRLEKPVDCQCCGSEPKRLHGHHDDYSLPLVVRWLCPGCHSQWHKKNGEGENSH